MARGALLAALSLTALAFAAVPVEADPLVAADREDDGEAACFRTTPATLDPLCVNEAFFFGRNPAGEGRFLEAGVGPDGPSVSHNVTLDVAVVGYEQDDGRGHELCYDVVDLETEPLFCMNVDLLFGHHSALPHGTLLRVHVGPDGPVVQAEPHGTVDSEAGIGMEDDGDDVCWQVGHDIDGWALESQCVDGQLLQGQDDVLPRGRWVTVGTERSY